VPTSNEKLSEKVDGILTSEIPEIKIRLVELGVTQQQMIVKIDELGDNVNSHLSRSEEIQKHMVNHDIRLASLEKSDATSEDRRLFWRRGTIQFLSALALAVISAYVGYWFTTSP
jgi:hypothetical protein